MFVRGLCLHAATQGQATSVLAARQDRHAGTSLKMGVLEKRDAMGRDLLYVT